MLFDNLGADSLNSASSKSVELFGGQDGDTLLLSSTGRASFTTCSGTSATTGSPLRAGYNTLYGGQGSDVLNVQADRGGGTTFIPGISATTSCSAEEGLATPFAAAWARIV